MEMTAVSNRGSVMDAERFLLKAISILSTSADLRTTIDSLAHLAAAEVADCCAVFMFENEQTVRRITVAHGTDCGPGTHQLDALYPLDLHASTGPGHILKTGENQIITPITPEIAPEILDGFGLQPGGWNPSTYVC